MLSEEEKQAIEYLNDFKSIEIMYGNTFVMFLEQLKKYQRATDAALNLIAKLQKENKELKQENKRIKYFSSNLFIGDYIPKKVIKDKIKEIEEDKECYYYDCFLEELDIEKTINILEELLGEQS